MKRYLLLLLLSLFGAPVFAQGVVMETPAPKNVKVPANLTQYRDDLMVTLTWNGYPNPNNDKTASGFEVHWGVDGTGQYPFSAPTVYNAFQVQPIEPGVSYRAQVRAVDKWGRASAWTPAGGMLLASDSTRVNIIRTICSVPGGFFDDFNMPKGVFDPIKHNFAVTRLSDEKVNMFSINAQYHAHLSTVSFRHDRGKVVDRPRQIIDISTGTRTVFMDFDSNFDSRNNWYLDLVPADDETRPPYDITNRVNIFGADPNAYDPPFLLRFSQGVTSVSVQTTGADGKFNFTSVVDLSRQPNLPKLMAMMNVRRPWKFTISKNLVEVYIFDYTATDPYVMDRYKKILSCPVSIPWNKARVLNTAFDYNGPKEGLQAWLWHFDNFGFDAPLGAAPDPVVYNYMTQLKNGAEYGATAYKTKSWVIKVPDKVQNWSHRLYYTVQAPDRNASRFISGPGNKITINGQDFPIPFTDDNLRSGYIDIPAGLLKTGGASVAPTPPAGPVAMNCTPQVGGPRLPKFYDAYQSPDVDNVIAFTFQGISGALNLHIESRRPANDPNPLPAYSSHCDIWGCDSKMGPAVFVNGADVTFIKVGTTDIWNWDISQGNWLLKTPIPVSGNLPCVVSVSQNSALTANGSPTPVSTIEFVVDGTVKLATSMVSDTNTLSGSYNFTLDTTTLTNGVHNLYIRTFSPTGVPSNPRYFDATSRNGVEDKQIFINVQN